jgi:hypothetical protein
MILIGLFNILYNVSYKLYTGALLGEGVGFTMPPKVLEVWNYLANVLANGKAIVSLFLEIYLMCIFWFNLLFSCGQQCLSLS